MGSLYIVSAILLWSSLGVIVRLSGVAVHILIFYASTVSVLVMGAMLLRKDYRAMVPSGKRLLYLLPLGPLSLLNTFTFFYAFKNTTISNAILTHYIAPVVVAFLAPVFLKEPLTKRVLFSVFTASVGLWVLLGISPEAVSTAWEAPTKETLGIMSGIISGFAYASIIMAARVYAQEFNPLVMAFVTNLTISLMLLPFVREFPSGALWSFLLMGVAHSTVAPILYYKGLAEVRASRAAIIGYIEPVGAIIFGMIFLGEYPALIALLGGALILFSGYLSITERR